MNWIGKTKIQDEFRKRSGLFIAVAKSGFGSGHDGTAVQDAEWAPRIGVLLKSSIKKCTV